MPAVRHQRNKHEPRFELHAALYTLLGADLSQIHGFGAYTVLRLVGECGDDMRKWPTAKHFTSWLSLAPGNKISGGRVLSSRTRKSTNRAAVVLRMAAMNIGKTHTAIGAFYRRLAARAGKAKAITATARKLAVLFYNALRFGMSYVDPAKTTTRRPIGGGSSINFTGGHNRWDLHWLARMPALAFLRKCAAYFAKDKP